MDALTASLSAAADPVRREILRHLMRGEASVTDIVAQFDLTQPTISSHIKVLEKAGLVTRSRVAQKRPCRLNPAGLRAIAEWVGEYERFWTGALDRFAEQAEREAGHEGKETSNE